MIRAKYFDIKQFKPDRVSDGWSTVCSSTSSFGIVIFDVKDNIENSPLADENSKDIKSLQHVQDICEPPSTFASFVLSQARNDFKSPDESHTNEQFGIHYEPKSR